MIPGLALEPIPAEKLKNLREYLADQFDLNSESNFAGLIPILYALYGMGIPQGIYDFLKSLHYIEIQLSGLIETLNTYLGGAGSAFSTGLDILSPTAVAGNEKIKREMLGEK